MTASTTGSVAALATENTNVKRITPLQRTFQTLRSSRSAIIGFWLVIFLILLGVFAPLIATHDPSQVLTGLPGYESIQKGTPPCIPALNNLGCAPLVNDIRTLTTARMGVTLDGETLVLNAGQAQIITADLAAGPNVVHVVDGILTPPDDSPYALNIQSLSFAPPLMLGVLENGDNGDFSILLAALAAAELDKSLASAIPFTLLAPTDAAMEAYFAAQGITEAEFLADPERITRTLAYHILPGKKDSVSIARLGSVTQNLHLMGVDLNFRDEFSRVVYGVRRSLPVGFAAVSMAIVVGTFIGLVSGYAGGWVDNIIMRLMDVLIAFPSLLLAIAIVTILGPGLLNALIAIAIVSIPQYARLIRASVLSIKEQEFITANRALGAGPVRILFMHILPNTITPIVVQGTLGIGTAILDAAALSFLGLGAQPPTPEWGLMLSEARADFRTFPHLMFFPGLMIMTTVLAFNLLGDGLRDALDPRLSKT